MNVAVNNPLDTLQNWLNEATAKNEVEPTACALGTVSKDSYPSVRIVLFKGLHEGKLAFVTNYESRKALEIDANPNVAVTFYWKTLNKQIRIEGQMQKSSANFSDSYWKSRERESQLSAWASPQSREIKSYEDLQKKLDEVRKKFEGKEIPRPESWGAYFLTPKIIELWQSGPHRLHQRTEYTFKNNTWIPRVLGP